MSAARVYYQMSKEGYFFQPFSKVHERFRTPHISLTGQMIWASLLIISGTFDQLTDMLIFAAFIFYGLGAVAVMRLKMQGKLELSFGYPWVPSLFLVFCIVIVANAVYTRPFESLSGLGLIVLGVPFYIYFKKINKERD
jgi:APA family basic amino acid/polyamine antiporter